MPRVFGSGVGQKSNREDGTPRQGMAQPIERIGNKDEAALLRRVALGETDAVAAFFRAHCDSTFQYVFRRVSDNFEDAQDLTQETFLAAISIADTYDGTCSVRTWICSLANKKLADFYRRQGRKKRVPNALRIEWDPETVAARSGFSQGSLSAEETAEKLDIRAFLDHVAAHLPEVERETLRMHYVEGFSVAEIAVLLGRSAKGIEALLTRAKHRCRQCASQWMFEG